MPAGGPDAGDPDAGDPYPDLYEARPEPDADGDGTAAPGTDPGNAPEPPGPEHPARRELPPGTVPVGVRGDDPEAAVDDSRPSAASAWPAPAPSRPPARSSPPCSPRPRPATRGCPP